MKKSIVLAALGLSVATTGAFGQGIINFDSYNALGGAGIITTFGSDQGANAGNGITTAFTAGLLYSLSPISDTASSVGNTALLGSWLVANQAPDSTTGTPIAVQFQSTSGGVAGYYTGAGNNGTFRLPTYTSGSVYFEVIAYNGSSYANATIRGHSASFTASLATGTSLAGFMDNAQPFSVFNAAVAPVPEPSTLALAGLGGFGMLMAMRRKKA